MCALALAALSAGAFGAAQAEAALKAPAIELATTTVAPSDRAIIAVRVPAPTTCVLSLLEAKARVTSQITTSRPIVEWRWRTGARAKAGALRATIRCARTPASLRKGRGAKAATTIRVVRGARARLGSTALVVRSSLTVRAREVVETGAQSVPQGETIQGLGAAVDFSPCECVWLANQRRPDISVAAVAAGVPAGGVATTGDDYWWNAWRWADNARRGGLPVGSTPVAGSIVVFPRSTSYSSYGHVGFVTSVNRDGSFNTEERGIPDVRGQFGCSAGRNQTKTFTRRSIEGTQFIYGGPAGNGGPVASPDSDGDGVSDVRDRCPAAAGPAANSGCPLQASAGRFQSFAGDFNGDGQADLGLRDTGSGMFYFRYGPDFAAQTVFQWDNSTDYQAFAGDFNGDNVVDAGLRNQQSGAFYARYGPGFATQTVFQWDHSAAYQSFAGDFNGDNQVDFALRNIQSGAFYARSGPAFATQTVFQWDNSTDYQSFAGDFNGDNQVDFGLRNIQSGAFYARSGPAFAAQTVFQWDNSTAYQSLAGDFNGDNQADFGLRNIQSGTFYLRYGPEFTAQTVFQWAPG